MREVGGADQDFDFMEPRVVYLQQQQHTRAAAYAHQKADRNKRSASHAVQNMH